MMIVVGPQLEFRQVDDNEALRQVLRQPAPAFQAELKLCNAPAEGHYDHSVGRSVNRSICRQSVSFLKMLDPFSAPS